MKKIFFAAAEFSSDLISKKRFGLLFAALMLSACFSSSLKADDCLPGYTEQTLSAAYTYVQPDQPTFICAVTIDYCCKWDNNLKTIVVEINSIVETNPHSDCIGYVPSYSDFLAWAQTVIAQNATLLCTPTYPPCDDENNPYYIIQISSDQCHHFEIFQPYSGDIYVLKLVSCHTDNYCQSKYRVCLDYSTTPPTLTTTLVSKTSYGTPSCSTIRPDLPPKVDDEWNAPWVSYCFATPCD